MAGLDEPLMEVTGLTTAFETSAGSLRAVDGVGFRIERGETLALVGESGCGKSVTALSLMRLVRPPGRILGGSIRFEGRDLMALGEAEMRGVRGALIALVPQDPMAALNPVFSIGDQVAESLIVHGRAGGAEALRQAIGLLRLVRLHEPDAVSGAYAHQLSGGMRQRVVLAMALACRPRLLIADEPTTALDVTIQAEILDLLADLRASLRLSLLFITHDLGLVAASADRVAVMYAGRIVEVGPTLQVLTRPRHPYTQGLVAALPPPGAARRPRARLRSIDGSVPDLAALPPGCAFAPRCPRRMARCERTAPPDTAVAAGEAVRCYLFGPEEE